MHATTFLKAPEKCEPGPVAVIYGKDRYLQQASLQALSTKVLGAEDADLGMTRFDGPSADVKTVRDELLTVSMWGDRRVVVVADADAFVSANRTGLEKYLESPAKKSLLVLIVKSWPKNTRLAKSVAKVGIDLQCAELRGVQLSRFLVESCRDEHGKQMSPATASLLTELAGQELGLLQQELAKLTAYVGDRRSIGVEDVRALVGGWKMETTWAMTGALQQGDVGTALGCLDKLLVAGEAPQKILGGITYVFRKLARATELAREGTTLKAALKQAGVFHGEINTSAQYLRRVGRPNAERFYERLLAADGDLKGNSRIPERLRLELLLFELSAR
jgi:DNA polymerase-3 subunit delta